MSAFLARMTQRGHEISGMNDLVDLMDKPASSSFINKLSNMQHGTIKRFDTYTVAIVGASRRFLAQIRTHQHADFVSGSLQYSDWSNNEDPGKMFVVPYELLGKDDLRTAYLDSCVDAFRTYQLLATDNKNDAAGFVLPNGVRNTLIIHANIQEWQYMIRLRTCRRNSAETRYVMLKIWDALQATPNGEEIFGYKSTGPACMSGRCPEGHMTCGAPCPYAHHTPDKLLKWFFPNLTGVTE